METIEKNIIFEKIKKVTKEKIIQKIIEDLEKQNIDGDLPKEYLHISWKELKGILNRRIRK